MIARFYLRVARSSCAKSLFPEIQPQYSYFKKENFWKGCSLTEWRTKMLSQRHFRRNMQLEYPINQLKQDPNTCNLLRRGTIRRPERMRSKENYNARKEKLPATTLKRNRCNSIPFLLLVQRSQVNLQNVVMYSSLYILSKRIHDDRGVFPTTTVSAGQN